MRMLSNTNQIEVMKYFHGIRGHTSITVTDLTSFTVTDLTEATPQ